METADRRRAYEQVLGSPRWNHASAHCVCDVDHPDEAGFMTDICRRNYQRALREHTERLDALIAVVDAEIAAVRSSRASRLARAKVVLSLPRRWSAPVATVRAALPRVSGLKVGSPGWRSLRARVRAVSVPIGVR